VPCNLTHVCCCLSDAGKHEEDPQNTEGTLTDNTDSRVGLKDTTDTTPGYFYKNEVLLIGLLCHFDKRLSWPRLGKASVLSNGCGARLCGYVKRLAGAGDPRRGELWPRSGRRVRLVIDVWRIVAQLSLKAVSLLFAAAWS